MEESTVLVSTGRFAGARPVRVVTGRMYICHIEFMTLKPFPSGDDLMEKIARGEKFVDWCFDEAEGGAEYSEFIACYRQNVAERLKEVKVYPAGGIYDLYVRVPGGAHVLTLLNLVKGGRPVVVCYEAEVYHAACGTGMRGTCESATGRNIWVLNLASFSCSCAGDLSGELMLRYRVRGPPVRTLMESSPGVFTVEKRGVTCEEEEKKKKRARHDAAEEQKKKSEETPERCEEEEKKKKKKEEEGDGEAAESSKVGVAEADGEVAEAKVVFTGLRRRGAIRRGSRDPRRRWGAALVEELGRNDDGASWRVKMGEGGEEEEYSLVLRRQKEAESRRVCAELEKALEQDEREGEGEVMETDV